VKVISTRTTGKHRPGPGRYRIAAPRRTRSRRPAVLAAGLAVAVGVALIPTVAATPAGSIPQQAVVFPWLSPPAAAASEPEAPDLVAVHTDTPVEEAEVPEEVVTVEVPEPTEDAAPADDPPAPTDTPETPVATPTTVEPGTTTTPTTTPAPSTPMTPTPEGDPEITTTPTPTPTTTQAPTTTPPATPTSRPSCQDPT
jgi:hypothetical protein